MKQKLVKFKVIHYFVNPNPHPAAKSQKLPMSSVRLVVQGKGTRIMMFSMQTNPHKCLKQNQVLYKNKNVWSYAHQ